MNEQNEDLKTINQTFETSSDCEIETLLLLKRLKVTQTDEGSVNGTCNSDSKSDPPFYPINIPVVKSRIGRPKGTNKPFWEFSKSKRPFSLKKIKRKCEDNETSEKIQRTNDVITDCSQWIHNS